MIIYGIKFINKGAHCLCDGGKRQYGIDAMPSKYWHTERGCEAWCSNADNKMPPLKNGIAGSSDINKAYHILNRWGNYFEGSYIVEIIYEE